MHIDNNSSKEFAFTIKIKSLSLLNILGLLEKQEDIKEDVLEEEIEELIRS